MPTLVMIVSFQGYKRQACLDVPGVCSGGLFALQALGSLQLLQQAPGWQRSKNW